MFILNYYLSSEDDWLRMALWTKTETWSGMVVCLCLCFEYVIRLTIKQKEQSEMFVVACFYSYSYMNLYHQ